MRTTLRTVLEDAVAASTEDRPREQFIAEFPAQISLVAGQITWNNDVVTAFEKLAENENALKVRARALDIVCATCALGRRR